MKTKLNILIVLAIAAALVGVNTGVATANIPESGYAEKDPINFTDASPTLTAVDPLAWGISGDVTPARPFLYSVDASGITITRFNDNQVVGTWPWPTDVIYTVLPDGSFAGLEPPSEWEPLAMTVSYPTDAELANRMKAIPDLTPPWTFVYVVMAHSGYKWQSSDGYFRDTIDESSPAEDSAMLIQIDVSDPSFSTSGDPVAPSGPHIAGAILGRGAGQPVYDRSNGNIYVGNMPSASLSLPAGTEDLTSFVSVIRRIPPEVTAEEAEIPGISKPVIRCGPQHPETGIPVGRPQAYACYDPSGVHPIDDNEHVGASGEFEWEFRNLPDWLTAHDGVLDADDITRGSDGILYGTPSETGEMWAEARVHNLDDPYGVFSDWHPIQLFVNPTAEYLPIKARFAAGVPVAYPLEGTGSCALSGAPAWVEIATVPNGCIVMGTAPLDGEYYNFTMPGFTVASYPDLSLRFSGNVFGEYSFVPLPEGVGISGMAWHQVSKEADPSTETPVLSLEYIGIDPTSGQLYQILAPPGQPQPPNERPPETVLTLDLVSEMGEPLPGSDFGEVAVEADRDIYVANENSVIKVSGADISPIVLGFQPSSLSLDSDLRTAIPGVEPGQSDHGVLWVAGEDMDDHGWVAVIDTDQAQIAQINTGTEEDPVLESLLYEVSGASSVSVDYSTQYAYVATQNVPSVHIFGPFARSLMEPRIWSSEEITFNRGFKTLADGPFQIMATGDPVPTLELLNEENLPEGLIFTEVLDGSGNPTGFATISGIPGPDTKGDYAFTVIATNSEGVYAQALGITVEVPPAISPPYITTFYAGSASSFTITGSGYPTPIFYTWDEDLLETAGVQLVDNEDGTASLVGTPTTPGTYMFELKATTGCPIYDGPDYHDDLEFDASQTFTLNVIEGPGGPVITSLNTAIWEAVGAPFSPDPITITSIGSPTPALSIQTAEGQTGLPTGVNFIDNGDSTGTLGADCRITWPGMDPSCLGLLDEGTQGTYTFNIIAQTIVEDVVINEDIQHFTLNLEHVTSLLGADPITISLVTDGTYIPEQTASLTTWGDSLPYALVTTADWLKASPESGWMPGGITISAKAAGLAPGTYTGTVIVGSAGTEGPFATIAVTLTVEGMLEEGTMGISPKALSFTYNVNEDTAPPAQTLWLMSGGVPLDYTVSTGEARWLSAPASGTAPGGFRVSVDPKVGVGMHIANLTITASEQSISIPVTLVKTAGDSDLIQVMFDVGSGPEGLTANLNSHNLFITSSNASAEAAEAGVPIIPVAELPGPPEPPLVFHIDPLNKSVVSQIIMHGEAEYIGFNNKTGIAYQSSQATGELAVIDAQTNRVLTYIDLTLNGQPQTPYQVAIDEAQNLIYVGAKSPEPEPYGLIKDENGKYGCMAIHELPSDEVANGELPELDCWHAGPVIVIDGKTNQVARDSEDNPIFFMAGDDPEGVVFAAATGKVYASNEDDGNITVARGAIRNDDNSIAPPVVLGTIIQGSLKPEWQLECDENNFCGEKENLEMWLWPTESACHGIDDEAEEADKMAVDPKGNVYIIDDRYRVAKIDAKTDAVVQVIEIGSVGKDFDCEKTVTDDSPVVFRNTANNIAYMPLGQGKLYVTSEQNTLTLIEWKVTRKKFTTTLTTLTLPEAAELDAITTDWALNQVYITDESLASLWILKGACANGVGIHCTQ